MRNVITSKPALIAVAGLSLAGALAGCSSTPADTSAPTTTTDGTTSAAPTSAPAAGGTYKDGTYTESADYQAPSGTETVDVTITLAADKVTAVTVAGHATDPQAKIHQSEFANGIGAEVVGKSIDELNVDKVGGSSLTSGGFNAAVDKIKADAAS